MTWEPGMIAVRIRPPVSDAGKKYTPMGRLLIVEAFFPQGSIVPIGRTTIGDTLAFVGIPNHNIVADLYGWSASSFHPLDDGDIQGLREKYGVSGKKERTE